MDVIQKFLRAFSVTALAIWVLYILVQLDLREAIPLEEWQITIGAGVGATIVFLWYALHDPGEELGFNNTIAMAACAVVWIIAAILVGTIGKSPWFWPTMISATICAVAGGVIWTDAEPPPAINEQGEFLYGSDMDD